MAGSEHPVTLSVDEYLQDTHGQRPGTLAGAPRISVAVKASDPLILSGLHEQLRPRPEILLCRDNTAERPQVTIVATDTLDEQALVDLRHIQRTSTSRLLIVVKTIDEQRLVSAAECGAAGVVRRSEVTPEHLVEVISTVARGDGHLPPDLLGQLLKEVGILQGQVLIPRGLHFTGLAAREVDVLRLVAEGYDTADIATKLSYSERTIKNVLHSVMTRLQLRNRAHAVAYVMRQGLI
ncbi:LuxR C-terminal-related transcriptional regulator [Streptomyces sp. NPDC001933]|uniref:helix-turn-helix transcriptional regulator n=1 Tax=Streptomyces sp. NPDC001933 TaxID=3364626 RepID=UPI0036A4AB0C